MEIYAIADGYVGATGGGETERRVALIQTQWGPK